MVASNCGMQLFETGYITQISIWDLPISFPSLSDGFKYAMARPVFIQEYKGIKVGV